MFGLRAAVCALALWGAADSAAAQAAPAEPKPAGERLLPGRLPWGPTALPTGEILAPCEDQTLYVVGAQAQVLTRWPSPARFAAPVTVGPRAGVQLLAAPLVSGRVEVLAWDPLTKTVSSSFAFTRAAVGVASAWSATGAVVAAWSDGHVESWSSHGDKLWETDVVANLRWLLVDEALGVYAVGQGVAVLLDGRGQETARWAFAGDPSGVLQNMAGDLFVWTATGLYRKALDSPAFVAIGGATRPLGVVSDRQDHLVLTEPTRLVRLNSDGTLLGAVPLPLPAVVPSALDDRGRVIVGTAGGVGVWTYDGRPLGLLDTSAPASAALLTDTGLGVWSSGDWSLHLWSGFKRPAYGWPGDGGGSGRPYAARRPSTAAARSLSWADDPTFGYFYQLAASGEEAKQSEVLDRFEAKAAQVSLTDAWPFANLILLKVARSGLIDLMLDHSRVVNTWPNLRLRAFALLARTAGPEDRTELLSLLAKEYDPAVAAWGARALARSGWDGDGKLMRLLADLRARMPDQAVVADAVVDSARTLWVENGLSADPVLIPLVSAIFQGPYPKGVKLKAQTLFQDLMAAP